jgi:hypothetical protein
MLFKVFFCFPINSNFRRCKNTLSLDINQPLDSSSPNIKDYVDVKIKLSEQNKILEEIIKLDKKFDKKFNETDKKIDEMQIKTDKKIDEMQIKIDKKIDEMQINTVKKLDKLDTDVQAIKDTINVGKGGIFLLTTILTIFGIANFSELLKLLNKIFPTS